MPSFFSRKFNVLRFMPRRTAAPLGPLTTPRVLFNTDTIWARDAASKL